MGVSGRELTLSLPVRYPLNAMLFCAGLYGVRNKISSTKSVANSSIFLLPFAKIRTGMEFAFQTRLITCHLPYLGW